MAALAARAVAMARALKHGGRAGGRLLLTLPGAFPPLTAVVLWLIGWLVLAELLVSTGALWWTLGDRLKAQRRYDLQARLFDDPPPRTIGMLVIGDRLFVNWLEAERPDILETSYRIAIPEFSLADVSAVADALSGHEIGQVVVQASPHLWTDYWFRSPAMDITLWQGYGSLHVPTIETAEQVFKTIASAVASGGAPDEADRPTSLTGTHPSDMPRNANRYLADIERLAGQLDAVTWLRDDRRAPADMPREVRGAFEQRMDPAIFDPEFGHAVAGPEDLTPSGGAGGDVR